METQKQKEVLLLISKGDNPTSIGRKTNRNKSTITNHLKACQKKGLVQKDNIADLWKLTKTGEKLILGGCVDGCPPPEKNIHSNRFTTSILELPPNWNQQTSFFQCLKAKNYFPNKSNNQWVVEFNECKVVISPTKNKIDFWIKKQTGSSYDEITMQVWDLFIEHYNLLSHKGFSLDNNIDTKNPEFANPNGFFAKLASVTNSKGYRIDTPTKNFYIDFSPPHRVAEEESTDEDTALRMENLANSALTSKSDFNDMDKCLEVVTQLVKLATIKAIPESHNPPQKLELLSERDNYFG